MKFDSFAKKVGLSSDDCWDKFLEFGYCKKNWKANSKFIKNGWLDEDCNVLNFKEFKEDFDSKLEEENESSATMSYAEVAKACDVTEDDLTTILIDEGYLTDDDEWTKKAKKFITEDDRITNEGFEKILELVEENTVNDDEDNDETSEEENDDDEEKLDFKTLYNTIDEATLNPVEISSIVKLLMNKLEEDSSEDDEDEEEEEDPNSPGKYKGWTIELNGTKVVATKGKKVLKTSIKGNIRSMIDDEE